MYVDLAQQLARRHVSEIATKILDGSIDPIEGCRTLLRFRENAMLDSSAFDVICAIESETDDYPVGSVRDKYSLSFLSCMDREVQQYLSDVRQSLVEACNQLIKDVEQKNNKGKNL